MTKLLQNLHDLHINPGHIRKCPNSILLDNMATFEKSDYVINDPGYLTKTLIIIIDANKRAKYSSK